MVSFNTSVLESWKSNGYRYIYILPFEKFGVVKPLMVDKEVKKGYTIEIQEMELIQFTEEYFLTKEKDAPLQTVTVNYQIKRRI